MAQLNLERNEEIRHLRAEGLSLSAIAERYALTRQRISQIVRDNGQRQSRPIKQAPSLTDDGPYGERTRAIAEILLGGEVLTVQDVINRGFAGTNAEARHVMSPVLCYLERYYPDSPIGFVPNPDSGCLPGKYKKLLTFEERIAVGKRKLRMARGHTRSATRGVTTAAAGLPPEEKAALAEACKPTFTQLLAEQTSVATALLGALDPGAAKRVLKNAALQLGQGK